MPKTVSFISIFFISNNYTLSLYLLVKIILKFSNMGNVSCNNILILVVMFGWVDNNSSMRKLINLRSMQVWMGDVDARQEEHELPYTV